MVKLEHLCKKVVSYSKPMDVFSLMFILEYLKKECKELEELEYNCTYIFNTFPFNEKVYKVYGGYTDEPIRNGVNLDNSFNITDYDWVESYLDILPGLNTEVEYTNRLVELLKSNNTIDYEYSSYLNAKYVQDFIKEGYYEAICYLVALTMFIESKNNSVSLVDAITKEDMYTITKLNIKWCTNIDLFEYPELEPTFVNILEKNTSKDNEVKTILEHVLQDSRFMSEETLRDKCKLASELLVPDVISSICNDIVTLFNIDNKYYNSLAVTWYPKSYVFWNKEELIEYNKLTNKIRRLFNKVISFFKKGVKSWLLRKQKQTK